MGHNDTSKGDDKLCRLIRMRLNLKSLARQHSHLKLLKDFDEGPSFYYRQDAFIIDSVEEEEPLNRERSLVVASIPLRSL